MIGVGEGLSLGCGKTEETAFVSETSSEETAEGASLDSVGGSSTVAPTSLISKKADTPNTAINAKKMI